MRKTMSKLPTLPDPSYHHQSLRPQPLPSTTAAVSGATSTIREYRKGNWTMEETLILISAKKLDDERRVKSSSTQHDSAITSKQPPCKSGGELRWKWVENYCFNHGCNRSQNQCNDKWDNLLRDYKKVREYESKLLTSENLQSYWKMEKHERKDRNLPSNMAVEVFEALNDVIQRRETQKNVCASPAPVVSTGVTLPAPADPPVDVPAVSDSYSDSSETSSSAKTKRQKVGNVGSSIIRSATILARKIKICDEKKEKRHQQVMEIEQRRIQIEGNQNEVNQQGFNDLVAAVTNLSGAIQSLVSGHRHTT